MTTPEAFAALSILCLLLGAAAVDPTMCSRCKKKPAIAAGCTNWVGPVCTGCSYEATYPGLTALQAIAMSVRQIEETL